MFAESDQVVELVSNLLGLDPAGLRRRLTSRSIRVRNTVCLDKYVCINLCADPLIRQQAVGDVVHKPLSSVDAQQNRDAIVKSVYEGLFHWVVARINRELFSSKHVWVVCCALLPYFTC